MEIVPKLLIATISMIIATIVIASLDITAIQIAYVIITDLIITIIATVYNSCISGYDRELKITTFLFYLGIMIALSMIALWRTGEIYGQHLVLIVFVAGIFFKWLLSGKT